MATDQNACLRRKVCWLCDQPLKEAAKGRCGSWFDTGACWWVPAIREHGAAGAIAIASKAKDEPPRQSGTVCGA